MGCVCIKLRAYDDDPTILADQTCFTAKDVKDLRELFQRLSSSVVDDGFINKEEFQLGLLGNSKQQSLFTDRMFSLFNSKNNGLIGFEEFVRALSIFHPDAPLAEKTAFAFQLYDIRGTGFIEREEVKEMILALLTESDLILSNELVGAIIDKTFEEADSKRDGKIDVEEWENFVARNPTVLKNMTVPYLKDITAAFPSFVQNPDIENELNNLH